jgi:hypothetical protein
MKLLFTLGWLPLVFVLMVLFAPFIGAAVHAVFFLSYLRHSYGPWAEYLWGFVLLAIIVFSWDYHKVFFFVMIPVFTLMWVYTA